MENLASEAKWVERKRRAKPSLDDYRKELPRGSVRVKELPDGTCDGQIVGREALFKLAAMNDELRRLDVEHGAEHNARVPGEALRDASGRVSVLPAERAERAARKRGLVPVVRHGGLKVERASDGLLWRRVGAEWECTGRCCLGVPMRPCGNAHCEACR